MYPSKLFLYQFADSYIPEIVGGPTNQSVLISSSVTFSCTAKGLLRSTIHWIKDNATDILQTNPRARVIPDRPTNRSQVLITGVEMEDSGKYQCIAKNGFKKSQPGVTFLNIGRIFFEKRKKIRILKTVTARTWLLEKNRESLDFQKPVSSSSLFRSSSASSFSSFSP